MFGTMAVKRGGCPSCGEPVILADAGEGRPPEAFEPAHVRMLVVLSCPEIEGKKRVALGPCQDDSRALHHPDEEPVVYFGHVKHRCAEKGAKR